MWPPTGPHAIRRNESSRMPNRFVIFDTEARREHPAPGREVQTWACAAARFIDLRPRNGKGSRVEDADFADPGVLWSWITKRATHDRRLVVVAHNLAYDLRISDAARELTALGWGHKHTRFHGAASWSRWSRGRSSLVMIDLWSWLPMPLDDIARMLDMRKLDLPPSDAPTDDLLARCRRDVEITAAAWTTILDWLRASDLGTWAMTGSGQAWNGWRHKFLTHRVVAHMNEAQHAVEREASWTARTEVWRWGKLPTGRYTEWDYSMSYARVAADGPVPVQWLPHIDDQAGSTHLERAHGFGWLARVKVKTTQPLVPARLKDGIGWPVGRFETVLWSPELEALEEAGGSYEVVAAWGYRLAPALRAVCRFLIDTATDDDADTPQIIRALCHQWGRSLIGRTGMRYSRLVPYFTADADDFHAWAETDGDGSPRRKIVQVGRDVQVEEADYSGPDAVPMIWAWVMSEARVRLWRTMTAAGLDHVCYADTDCVITDEAGSRRLGRAVGAGKLPGLRRKGVWGTVELRAPRQIVLDDRLRASGIPRSARRLSQAEWSARIWRGLMESWRRSEPDRVTITERTLRPRAVDRRRRHLPGGATRPYTLRAP